MSIAASVARWAQSPFVRGLFLVLALGGAVWAIVGNWGQVLLALSALSVLSVILGLGVSLGHVAFQMLSWHALMHDMGPAIPVRSSALIFFVSQMGKYIPGGVWNVVAATELAHDRNIPRSRTVSVMLAFWYVSVATGLGVAAASLPWSALQARSSFAWLIWALPVMALLLVPPLMNRALGGLFKVARRPGEAPRITARGAVAALGWAALSWAAAGLQLWLLSNGATGGALSYIEAVGAYALAWTAGFLFVLAPAGVGVREVVLVGVLGSQMSPGVVIVVIVMSRVLITAADVLLGAGAWLVRAGRPGAVSR